MTFKFVIGAAFATLFVAVGLLCLLFPLRVRAFYVDQFRRAITTAGLQDFSFLLEKIPGARFFRFYGVVSLATAALIVAALLWR
ncbi:MAG: hypothetical protein QOE33_3588 [Acidobacteriota bacterium]|nr:hypothetical protein [Acidobacteriota bacterium]